MRVTDLRALRDKYEQMLRLRQLHSRAKEEPDFVEPDPRPAMADLARRFPGALREIDEMSIDDIEARIAELAAAEHEPSRLASWMTAQGAFHRLARGALVAKRWLAGRTLTPELEQAFVEAVQAMPERDEALAWKDDLAVIAKPPRGRVMDVVYVRLARELGVDVSAARNAVLAPCRHSLRRGGPRT